jgi:hypothetical protein
MHTGGAASERDGALRKARVGGPSIASRRRPGSDHSGLRHPRLLIRARVRCRGRSGANTEVGRRKPSPENACRASLRVLAPKVRYFLAWAERRATGESAPLPPAPGRFAQLSLGGPSLWAAVDRRPAGAPASTARPGRRRRRGSLLQVRPATGAGRGEPLPPGGFPAAA